MDAFVFSMNVSVNTFVLKKLEHERELVFFFKGWTWLYTENLLLDSIIIFSFRLVFALWDELFYIHMCWGVILFSCIELGIFKNTSIPCERNLRTPRLYGPGWPVWPVPRYAPIGWVVRARSGLRVRISILRFGIFIISAEYWYIIIFKRLSEIIYKYM